MCPNDYTPTPWVIDPKYPSEVQTPDLNTICSVWHEHAEGKTITVTGVHPASLAESAANAAFIVKAVNAYEANQSLIAKLTEALESVKPWMIPGMNWTDETGQLVKSMVDEALSLAKSSGLSRAETAFQSDRRI